MTSSFPKPYTMCHEDECRERQSRNEVSEWEATLDTSDLKPRYRIMDPRLAIKKYRRSAAGGYKQHPPRSLDSLQQTLQHLFQLLARQAVYSNQERKSMVSTICFVDDRIRALQVDLVVSQEACGKMQAQMVRYHLLVMYLLSDVPAKLYEPKFANKALWTALSAYWNDSNNEKEEMLCLASLCRVASCLLREETALPPISRVDESSNTGYSSLFQNYRTHDISMTAKTSPALFALQVASAAHSGHYWKILDLLSRENDGFHILSRCCMVPALNVIRIGCLRQYNKCFGKGEKISGQEMARLLFLQSEQAALEFCHSVGLPLHEDTHVIMKSAPISITDAAVIKKMQSASRLDDDFVFGKDWKMKMKNIENDNWEESARLDEDGVLIPPGKLFAELIQFESRSH